jgi:RNA polymerase sigma factor (sigma-70 family)
VESIEEAAVVSDDALVERAREGDADAYASLVLRFQEIAFRVAYLIVGNAVEAEDAAQEAFIKAFYGLRRFRAGAPFRPWLLEIVANQARNQRRAGGRYDAVVLRAITAERSPTASNETVSPEASALAREHRQAVLAALGNLRNEDRQVVVYRFFLELSEAEMAAALGCARGTVKSRLSRALERLRHALVTHSEVGGG